MLQERLLHVTSQMVNSRLISTGFRWAVLLVLFSGTVVACAGGGQARRGATEMVLTNFGLEVVGISLTAAGQMIDFRYRVVDTEKAAPVMRPRNRAYLVHERTGLKMKVPSLPKVGSLRQFSSVAKKNRNYAILFSNPGLLIRSGDLVTIQIGEMIIEHLVVE